MQFYRATNSMDDECEPEYMCTQDEAKEWMRNVIFTERRFYRIELVEVPTDKQSICVLLNSPRTLIGTVLRTWKGTERGGLKEIANGE